MIELITGKVSPTQQELSVILSIVVIIINVIMITELPLSEQL